MVAIAFSRSVRFAAGRAGSRGRHDPALLREVRERETALAAAADVDLRIALEQLRDRIGSGTPPGHSAVLLPGLALTAEAVRRALARRAYDVQILAGAALARGAIAEMQTGEGKTIAALFPAVIHALQGRGVHVITSNAYLASRDCALLTPVFELLGLTCRLLESDASAEQKREAYQADVTYGPAHEFGFDFLRDELASRPATAPLGSTLLETLHHRAPAQQRLQRGLAFAVIDEADNVLLDDACSPLVLSAGGGGDAPDAAVHHLARQTALTLQPLDDYRCDPATGAMELTPHGEVVIHQALDLAAAAQLRRPWTAYVLQALRAEHLMRRNIHYVVEDGAVRIVDQTTGRIFADRSWQDGLHQAVEAREQLRIREEQRGVARVTRQRFFRMYAGLCGMTGTAAGSEQEFHSVYGAEVVAIPLRTPSRRILHPTRAFVDRTAKREALCEEALRRHRRGQPVLIGTRSIQESEELAARLADAGASHRLLNGCQDAAEADVIAAAGEPAAITIATNLAGRGTDIHLHPDARERGGLCVLAAERQESHRIDRQLIGRCARQGDPGDAQSFVAADDSLLQQDGDWLSNAIWRSADKHGEAQLDIEPGIARIQQRLERERARLRRHLLRSDEHRDTLAARFLGVEQ